MKKRMKGGARKTITSLQVKIKSLSETLLPTPNFTGGRTGMDKHKAARRQRGVKTGGEDLATVIGLLPTPLESDATGGRTSKGKNRPNEAGLAKTVSSLLPPESARDYKGENSDEHLEKERGHHDQLPNALKMHGQNNGSTLRLEPAFVEWMMGYPENWTSLEAETTEPID